jgi:hypothetical protein
VSNHPRGRRRAERAAFGAKLPSHRAARGAVAVGAGSGWDRDGEGCAASGWLLLTKTGWRRVDTLRVRRLFG